MSDIDKHRAALAALIAARDACAEAGYRVDCAALRYAEGGALDALVTDAEKRISSAERRAQPIAFGDLVTVVGVNDSRGGGPGRAPVVSVGRTLIHLADGRAYRLDTGRWNDGSYGFHYHIDTDDLARIKRDLVGKRPPKPAPVPQEIATVTKVTP
tara:strand:- start:2 stop:469 length:468 start_codon:yes stop_codon:yes gene_type:complete